MMADHKITQHDKLLRASEVESRTGLTERWLRDLEKTGEFPARTKLVPGGRAVGWSENEVQEWIEARLAERDH